MGAASGTGEWTAFARNRSSTATQHGCDPYVLVQDGSWHEPRRSAAGWWITAAAVLLWTLTAASLVLVGSVVALLTLWTMAVGQSPALIIATTLGAIAAAAAVLTALYFAPGVRRLPDHTRVALTGATAAPVSLWLATTLWTGMH